MESGLPDRAKAGSSLRHWPPGTNSKTFVPSFFAIATRFHRNAQLSAQSFSLPWGQRLQPAPDFVCV